MKLPSKMLQIQSCLKGKAKKIIWVFLFQNMANFEAFTRQFHHSMTL